MAVLKYRNGSNWEELSFMPPIKDAAYILPNSQVKVTNDNTYFNNLQYMTDIYFYNFPTNHNLIPLIDSGNLQVKQDGIVWIGGMMHVVSSVSTNGQTYQQHVGFTDSNNNTQGGMIGHGVSSNTWCRITCPTRPYLVTAGTKIFLYGKSGTTGTNFTTQTGATSKFWFYFCPF